MERKYCGNPRCAGHALNDPTIGKSPDHPVVVSGGLMLFWIVTLIVGATIIAMLGAES